MLWYNWNKTLLDMRLFENNQLQMVRYHTTSPILPDQHTTLHAFLLEFPLIKYNSQPCGSESNTEKKKKVMACSLCYQNSNQQ